MRIPAGLTRAIARQVIFTQKHAPSILWTGGVACGIGATISACRATLKLEPILSTLEDNLGRAKRMNERRPDEYPAKSLSKDKVVFYTKAATDLTRLYGPAIILGSSAIAMLAGSNSILLKRNAGLTAAYTTLLQAFNDYRGRVISQFGEDKDREFRFGSKERTIIEETDQGPKTRQIKSSDGKHYPYAKFFEEGNQNWENRPEYNLLFLRSQQNWANDRLKARGHVFLNEVYDSLGLERTAAGAVTGWIWDPERPEVTGDGYISFGVFEDESKARFHDYVIGEEGAILLDFNVDGVIYDKF